jgi:tetratricopeptide (TPR) repeat protein
MADPIAWDVMRARLTANGLVDPTSKPQPHSGGLVAASQLNVPPKAMKEFERSQKAFKSGDVQSSTAHLQKAIRIYPEFIDAHNVLGLRFLQLGQYSQALAEHESALAVDPRVALTHEGLALALLVLKRPQESEAEAREAMDLNPQALGPRYILARALIEQRRVTPEAVEMLRQAEDAVPNASLVLAQIYFGRGQIDQVVPELRRYLRAPVDEENKQKAECWVAQLSGQALPAGCPADVTRPSFH